MDLVLHRMSAAGNAFYLAVGRSLPLAHAEELAQVLSRGDALWPLDDASPPDLSDGLIFGLLAGGGAPPRQIMHNPDGSRGHCANGVRCLAWLLAAGNALPTPPRILTDDGEIPVTVDGDRVEAALGPLRTLAGWTPPDQLAEIVLNGETLRGYPAYVGNPQFVLFGDVSLEARLATVGAALQTHPRFPDGVNVEFVFEDPAAPEGEDGWRVRVWERGVGETLSCGTGALAVAAVGPRGLARGAARPLRYPGGTLTVRRSHDDRLHLSGEVQHEGRYALAPELAARIADGVGGQT